MKKITELNQTEIAIIGGGVPIFAKILIGPAVCFTAGSIVSHSILSAQQIPLLVRIPLAATTNFIWAITGIFIGFNVAGIRF